MCSPTVTHHYHLFCRIEWTGMRIYHTTTSRLLHPCCLEQTWWRMRAYALHLLYWFLLVSDFRLCVTHHNVEFCAISFYSEVLDTLYNKCGEYKYILWIWSRRKLLLKDKIRSRHFAHLWCTETTFRPLPLRCHDIVDVLQRDCDEQLPPRH